MIKSIKKEVEKMQTLIPAYKKAHKKALSIKHNTYQTLALASFVIILVLYGSMHAQDKLCFLSTRRGSLLIHGIMEKYISVNKNCR